MPQHIWVIFVCVGGVLLVNLGAGVYYWRVVRPKQQADADGAGGDAIVIAVEAVPVAAMKGVVVGEVVDNAPDVGSEAPSCGSQ